MTSFDKKYYRSLQNFDFENITKDTFSILVEAGIFNVFELSETYKNDEDYFANDGKMGFGSFYINDGKQYLLKNEILTEMIYVKNWFLDSFYDSDVSRYTDEIAQLIESEFDLEKKLKIIEDSYKKYFSEIITDKRYYPLFKNNSTTNGYKSWEEYIYDEIIESERFELVSNFLKGNDDFLPTEISQNWTEYFIFSGISDFCEKKKNELLNITVSNMSKTEQESPGKKRDLSFCLSLFELLMKREGWDDLSATKKGEVLTHLFGNHSTNIRDYYLEMDKPDKGKFKDGGKWQNEQKEAEEIIKKLLG